MSLTGRQYKQLQAALLAAFDEAGLRELARFRLEQDLDRIAGGNNLQELTYAFIQWADRQGRTADLITGALNEVPSNPELIALANAAETWHVTPPAPAEHPPYKGLQAYDVTDASIFYGRAALTAQLLTYIEKHHFLAIVGASGSGKSSVLRAGIVAQLRQGKAIEGSEHWKIHVIKPGAHPLRTLAAELIQIGASPSAQNELIEAMQRNSQILDQHVARKLAHDGAPRMVLAVDQFEELFTLCQDGSERKAFVDNLLTAAAEGGTLILVIALRADFYAQCAEFENLRLALQAGQRYIGRMSAIELRTVIEEPTLAEGWDLEPGLTARLLKDVVDQPGSLPLLSHALLETWLRRSGRLLTLAGYEEAGGVQGAIANTADTVFNALSPEEQVIARNIFLRLTAMEAGAEDTRRRVALSELTDGPQPLAVQALLTHLQNARLVTTEADGEGGISVEVAHEALIRAWPRLRGWLDEDRAALQTLRRLTKAEQEWTELQHDPAMLMRGALLVQVTEWAATHPDDLNAREIVFLTLSQEQESAALAAKERLQREREEALQGAVTAAEALAEEERDRAAEQQHHNEQQASAARQLRRLNWGLTALTICAVIAAILAGKFFLQAQERAALADAKLKDLEGERLLQEGRRLRSILDAPGAIDAFTRAGRHDPRLLEVSNEISDTLRFVATQYVREAERILCQAKAAARACASLEEPGASLSPVVQIGTDYLTWANETVQQLTGWSPDLPTMQLQATISATALFSQALALQPPADTPIYIWIAPGEFEMGSTDTQCQLAGIDKCYPEEQPSHRVKLDGYWLQRTEVTNDQYKRCFVSGGCPSQPQENSYWDLPRWSEHPVTHVDWNQARAYAAWAGGRLPTEAEWEYACRGGDGRIYPWGNSAPDAKLTNYQLEVNGTTEVGTFPPGANGLYDMAGNLWEWTQDLYTISYAASSAGGSDIATDNSVLRVLRGGGWNDKTGDVRCAQRFNNVAGSWGIGIGFRVLMPDFSQ